MTGRVSLFAQRLRAYRAAAPGHGRMTQEQLAEELGVSIDAIGKYERSLSFVRGDYEARLIERLGWSPSDVAACRADWEAHHLRPRAGGYRLLDDAVLKTQFGGSFAEVARAITQLVISEMPDIGDGFGADDSLWVPIIERFSSHGGIVLQGEKLVAHWGLQFIDAEHVDRFRDRTFVETDLDVDRLVRPVLPGHYFAYCPVVAIARGHEGAAPLLLASFRQFLDELADRDVLIEGIGAAAVTPDGRQFCRQLGFASLGPHRALPSYEMWELSGAALARSILTRGNGRIRAAYDAAFGI